MILMQFQFLLFYTIILISKDYKLSNTSIGNKNFIKSLNKKKILKLVV